MELRFVSGQFSTKRLDHFLLQKAADAGADVREGVTVDARELDARIVIGADGCNGTSAKQLGLGGDVVHGVALEANYPHDPRYAGAMVLEIAVIRGGYGWVFPKGDHINVGVGGNESEGPRLRAELRRMCEAYGVDPDAAVETRGYRLPLRKPSSVLARGNAAVIGDAAGLVDPFSGDGMFTLGNLSRQWNGRQASMMAREFVVFPFAFSSGGMRGSSGVLQALVMMSIDVAGSERVSIAQTNSSRLVTSMSSSTTITYLPQYAPAWHCETTCPACLAWPP